jgi:hypothetical protein
VYSRCWLVGNLGSELYRKVALVNVVPFPCATYFPINVFFFFFFLHPNSIFCVSRAVRDVNGVTITSRTLYSAVEYRNWIRRCRLRHKTEFVPKLETWCFWNIMIFKPFSYLIRPVFVTYIWGVSNMKQFTSRIILKYWTLRQYGRKN